MKNEIYPCLWFDNNAAEAAHFYCHLFEDSRILAENPIALSFRLSGRKFMALNGGPMFKINPSISFFVFLNPGEDIDSKWMQLTEGGSVLMPINKYAWSERYGWCQDKYGVNWQLMIVAEPQPERIVPSFMFIGHNNGKTEAAMQYYTAVFSNSRIDYIDRYTEEEADTEGNIKHARFYLNGHSFAAMESSAGFGFNFNEGVSLVVGCDTQEEIDYYWDTLTKEGAESRCGWLKDKFGVSWQIVPNILPELMNNKERSDQSAKVIAAFMKMNKFDIATLLKAAE